jgi:hypothetical protein
MVFRAEKFADGYNSFSIFKSTVHVNGFTKEVLLYISITLEKVGYFSSYVLVHFHRRFLVREMNVWRNETKRRTKG